MFFYIRMGAIIHFGMYIVSENSQQSWWIDLVWLTLVIGAIIYCFLGIPPFFTPDEARYAEIPREMLATHQFIIPYVDGVMFFDKPPLAYWMLAGLMKLFGYSEWVARSSVATCGLLGCLATYFTARKLFNRRTGILSALILSSCLLYFVMSHYNTLDMAFTFFVSLSLYSFILAVQHPKSIKRDGWLLAGYVFSGLAMLTKESIGIVFPAAIVFIWIAYTRRWNLIKEMRIISGVVIIALINLPWLLLAQKHEPAFLHYYFVVQQFERYTTAEQHREMAFSSYVGVSLFGLFPWVVWLPQTLKYNVSRLLNTKELREKIIYFIIWPAFIFLFFAFSHSVLIPYLIPIVPPLAIVMARYFDVTWFDKINKTQKISGFIYCFIILLLGLALFCLPHFYTVSTRLGIYLTGIIYIIGILSILFIMKRYAIKQLFIMVLLVTYFTGILLWFNASNFNINSIKPLALTLNAIMLKTPNAEIVSYGHYYQDLPYYTHRKVSIVTNAHVNISDELTFGFNHDPNVKNWIITDEIFWQQWNSHQRLYAIMSLNQYHGFLANPSIKIYLVAETAHDVLVTNKIPLQ